MPDLTTLSAKALHVVIARTDERWSETLDETLAAGMGALRHSDIVELAKGTSICNRVLIARNYLAAHHEWKAARDELDRRRDYHGNDKPIKRHVQTVDKIRKE